jgi:hypothetical protein
MLGILNPLLSAAVNRSCKGINNSLLVDYGELHKSRDVYGDLIVSGRKPEATRTAETGRFHHVLNPASIQGALRLRIRATNTRLLKVLGNVPACSGKICEGTV